MLSRIDRVVLAVPDARAAAESWRRLLEAEEAGRSRSRAFGATILTLRTGTGRVELMEPDGAGPVAAAVAERGAHLFAAGMASPDPAALAAHLRAQGAAVVEEDGRLLLDPAATGIAGLTAVVSAQEALPAVGLIDFLYEVTLLGADSAGLCQQMARRFGLALDNFTPITSETFGYTGTLTLFRPRQLDRFEVITPTVPGTTMERFFRRQGQVLYMAFAESARILEIERRCGGHGLTIDRPAGRGADRPADQIWLHPKTLGGLMLGISRPTMAWTWSGAPERVEAVA